jgi:hypothetical protein
MGYGLCGNGLVGLKSRRHHLVVPRVDDCIPLLLGSYQAYLDNLQVHPGTYFLSRGWLESEQHPVAQLAEWSVRYGRAEAEKLLDEMYRNYRRVAFVALDPSELPRYRLQARAVADLLGVEYVEIVGTTDLLRRLVRYQEGRSSDDVILAPPGTTLTQRPFVRM